MPELAWAPVKCQAVDTLLVVRTGIERVVEVRVSHLVLRDGAEGDVLFGAGPEPRPLRMPVADDELAVGEKEEELTVRVA